MCPPVNHGASLWWCGDSVQATPCENVSVGHFVSYTGGSVLGLPPVTTSSLSPSAQVIATSSSGGSATAASPSPTSAKAEVSSKADDSNVTTATAIGAGVGVPLGVAAVGLIAFLFWRESGRRRTVKPKRMNLRDDSYEQRFSEVPNVEERMAELSGPHGVRELGHERM